MPTYAQPLPYTLLSLPRYAQIMGINPVHFMGAFGDNVFFAGGVCGDIWPRYSWQNADRVAHHDLALLIKEAEDDLKRLLHFSVAPDWESQEVHEWPRPYRRDLYFRKTLNVRYQQQSIRTLWGKVIEGGVRAVSLVGTATTAGGTLVYSDPDGDGFSERATITLPTALTSTTGLKVYFAAEGGAREWEIRPIVSMSIAGGTLTVIADSWLFIDPDLLSAMPSMDGYAAVNITTTANYVTSVDVYREYVDTTVPNVEFLWGASPNVCFPFDNALTVSLTAQDGFLLVRDAELGVVVPYPAEYSAADDQWTKVAYTICHAPEQVKLWYYAGNYSERWLAGNVLDPLDDYWAQTIAWLATARMERPPCACDNVEHVHLKLREELQRNTRDKSYFMSPNVLENPLGTRYGEVMVWRRIAKVADALVGGVAV